jgi:hypothetical protein
MRQTRKRRARIITLLLLLGAAAPRGALQAAEQADVDRLVAALLGNTPLLDDLRELTDEIGGRPTGSEANRRSVDWALERFRQAGVAARKEVFTVPEGWLERSARAEVRGDASFAVRVASMPYSAPTPDGGLVASLVDGGPGGEEDFERLGERAGGAFVLVDTPPLLDLPGLFAEYMTASAVEARAEEAGVAGLVYVGSRPPGVLYRQIVARGADNELPMLVVERDAGMRLLRLLRAGRSLALFVDLDIEAGGTFESHNVIAEIPGRELPEEIVVAGAHLDSWGLGQGALDNGSGVTLLISGRIVGFFTNGRPELNPALDRALEPVRGLGPFENPDLPIVGTDNFDFMLQGVANLVGDQESANYGPNYHASSDTFDKIDQRQLRLNAAIAAAVTWSFAEMDVDWKRQGRTEVQEIIDTTDLGKEMRAFHLMESWDKGERGLPK